MDEHTTDGQNDKRTYRDCFTVLDGLAIITYTNADMKTVNIIVTNVKLSRNISLSKRIPLDSTQISFTHSPTSLMLLFQ